jgi:preprotein translocase subunit SecD
MPDFKVLEKARQVQDATAAKAKELSQQAPEFRGKVGGTAAQIKERVTATVTEAMDASFTKVTSLLDDLNAALPVLQEAGYPVDLVEIELGLSPKVNIRFSTKMGVKEDRFNSLIEEHAEHKMTITLLNSLAKAKSLQSRIRVAGCKPKGIEIKIGLMPEVALRFG